MSDFPEQPPAKESDRPSGFCLPGTGNSLTQLDGVTSSTSFLATPSPLISQAGTAFQSPSLDKTPGSSLYRPPLFGQASERFLPTSLLPPPGGPSFLTTSSAASEGAFRPVVTSSGSSGNSLRPSINGFHGSAFVPPSKPLGADGFGRFHQSDAATSSAFVSTSDGRSVDKDDGQRSPFLEDRLTPGSDAGSERATPEEGRSLRRSKKKSLEGQSQFCPVCGVTIRSSEFDAHFEQEVEKLHRISKTIKRPSRENTPQNRQSSYVGSSKKKEGSNLPEKGSPGSRWESYQRVKANRKNRLNSLGGRKRKPTEEAQCPVCSEKLTGTPEELTDHVEKCLRKAENEEDPVDVEGDDSFEEYEWAGQTRVRAASLLEGGFSGSGFQSSKHTAEDDDDQDLNVDGDDSVTYGQAQYTEADVIPCKSGEPSEDIERQQLRQALLIHETQRQEPSKWDATETSEENPAGSADDRQSNESEKESSTVILSLKEKVRELEEQKSIEKIKCLICMEPYVKPVVSVCCWHVHCEDCWLKTLGAKKLCPQCNTITSPSDLRRIYL